MIEVAPRAQPTPYSRMPVLTNGRTKVMSYLMLYVGIAVVACAAPDRTITRDSDGDAAWSRRLAATVPVGMSADYARAIMLRNGFDCHDGADSSAYIWCSKMSGPGIVQRRWQAVIVLNAEGVVAVSRASTGLIGPR